MKKRTLIVESIVSGMLLLAGIGVYCCFARPDSILEQNIQALAEQESGGIYGHCSEQGGACFYRCPNCNSLYEARGHGGGSYDMGGSCVVCREKAEN